MDRAQYLGRLEAEAVLAEGYGETARAAELRAQARRMSAGSAQSPARETAARQQGRKEVRGDARDVTVVPGRSRAPRLD